MDRIYIKPGPTNKAGAHEGHWMIMVSQKADNGEQRDWCCNDKRDRTAAEVAAGGAAERRHLPLDLGGTNNGAGSDESRVAPLSGPKDYMKVARPRGAPMIGERIAEPLLAAFNPIHDQVIESTVTDYLAEQFVTETDDGKTRIVHVKADFKVIGR